MLNQQAGFFLQTVSLKYLNTMKTIKSFKIFAVAMVAIASAMFTGCTSDDDDLFANYDGDVENPMTRAAVRGDSTIITFDDFESGMAMPTSYGANYYGAVGSYSKVTSISDGIFTSTVNTISGTTGILEWRYRTFKMEYNV